MGSKSEYMNSVNTKFDDKFLSVVEAEVGDWIEASKLSITTGIPQAGVVRKARQKRALKVFLMRYLTCSQYYPIGEWKIKLQIPSVQEKDSYKNSGESTSMRSAIEREGLEVFYVEFPYQVKSSPYSEKLPLTTGSISERLSHLGENCQSTFDINNYDGSKPCEKNYPSGFDIAAMVSCLHDELTSLEILVFKGLDL